MLEARLNILCLCVTKTSHPHRINVFSSGFSNPPEMLIGSMEGSSYSVGEIPTGKIMTTDSSLCLLKQRVNEEEGEITSMRRCISFYKFLKSGDGCCGDIVIPECVVYENKIYTVTSIGNEAFSRSSALTSVTLPDSVKSIGDKAFYGCSNLNSVTLPASLMSIGDEAFGDCSYLEAFLLAADNPMFCTVDGVLLTKDKSRLIAYPKGKSGSYTVPDGVTSIGNKAFSFCRNLTSVTMPDSVTSIGDEAFLACDGLTSVKLPAALTSIGDFAFCGCSALTSVTIPDSVMSIGYMAFCWCKNLKHIFCNFDEEPFVDKGAFYKGPFSRTIYTKNIYIDMVPFEANRRVVCL